MTHPEEKPQGEPEAEETSAEEMPGNASDVRIAALEEELLQTKDRLMRALAEGENTRKRALKERDDAGKYAVSSFAKDLLDFSDNFSRALGAIPEDLKGVDRSAAVSTATCSFEDKGGVASAITASRWEEMPL